MNVALSPRQSQMLALVANGYCVKEAARELGIDYGTAKVHLTLARAKLAARSNAQAAATAIRRGLI